MKKFVLFLAVTGISNVLPAQSSPEQKSDSICRLFKKHFNEKSTAQLYELTGAEFKDKVSADAFKSTCEQNFYPLGVMNKVSPEKHSDGVSTYKAEFTSASFVLTMSIDKSDKLAGVSLRPYINERKIYKIASTNALTTPLDIAVDLAVQPYISMLATAGLSIGIITGGKVIYYGYGETVKGNKQLPDEHTIFEIGSISKTFTSILLADAVNSGRVKLNDAVNMYLPDSIPPLVYEGFPVTLLTLSNHTSGLPGLPFNFYSSNNSNPYKNYDYNDLYRFYKYFRLTRKPGSTYEYSNLAAATLGVILENVYHKTYEALIIEKICKPLRMNETKQFLRKNDSTRFAKGYNDTGVGNSQWDFKALAAAGAIRSTAADLVKYAKAVLGEAPASLKQAMEHTYAVTFTNGAKVGLGWHYIKPGMDEVLFHNGQTGGYSSYLAINQNKKFAVVILSNCKKGTDEVGNAIMKWLETHQ